MTRIITITLEGGPQLEGFRTYWAKGVTGFSSATHCAACLRGPVLTPHGRRWPAMNAPTVYALPPRAVALYVCGVTHRGRGGSWAANFHAPLQHAPGEQVVLPMFLGQVFRADDARLLPIPPLPDGFGGLPRSFTTCRNYAWAVDFFGPGPGPRDPGSAVLPVA